MKNKLLLVLLVATLVAIFSTAAHAQYIETTLYNFGNVPGDATAPSGNITFDSAGNIYGASTSGGLGYGTIFELSPSAGTWTNHVLYAFTGGTDGKFPNGGVVLDRDGNIYGTTQEGGHYRCGTVFELSPNSDGTYTETVLHNFTGGADGKNPLAGLNGSDQYFWGTTYKGGTGYGVVFLIYNTSSYGWIERVFYTFQGGTDGAWPTAGIIGDIEGNLYGTAAFGGDPTCRCGTVFQIMHAEGYGYHVLHTFLGPDGKTPLANLALDASGNLYGTASAGGSTGLFGTVFKLTPNVGGYWKYTLIHSFTNTYDGATPDTPVTLDPSGNLFGTTWSSKTAMGTAFKLGPTSGNWTYATIYSFTGGSDGGAPQSNLLLDAAGNLYGTTTAYGANSKGTAFELSPE